MTSKHDVIIIGGGLAGLTLAVQLKRADSGIDVVVLEKEDYPFPEAAHKVGESSVEIAGRYLADVLGMKEHLTKEHLPKPGLRFYLPAEGANGDPGKRVEMGFRKWPKFPTYQIDRGRFENALAEEVKRLGVDLRGGTSVESLEVADGGDHVVTVEHKGEKATLAGRWLVDASGWTQILKRKLKLHGEQPEHRVSAAWFRVAEPLNVHDLSDVPAWRERCTPDLRHMATNHLMGPGYWLWFIPLAGGCDKGSTSIGIVADNDFHDFDTFNTLEKALAWIDENEPAAAKLIRQHEDKILDFKKLRRYAHDSQRVFSTARWATTGVAGVFQDPLYSPGSDVIYLANTMLTRLVALDKQGEDITELLEASNQILLELHGALMSAFYDKYPLIGTNTQVTVHKVAADHFLYWGVLGLLAYQDDKLTDPEFFGSIVDQVERLAGVADRIADLLHQWRKLESLPRKQGQFVDTYGDKSYLYKLHVELDAELSDDELRERIRDNVTAYEELSIEIFRQAVQCCLPDQVDRIAGRPLNPEAIGLDPERWEEDGLFDPDKAIQARPAIVEDVSSRLLEVAQDAQPSLAQSS